MDAPIVPIKEDVVILPLVGDIDTNKTNYIMEYVILKMVDMEIDYVIADFSGISVLNTETATALNQIGSMLRLMGIHVITTGLRPVVKGGIDISKPDIYATVKQALESIK